MGERPLLDLYCCAGGAATGYHHSGFDTIVGVDNRPQPNYPFTFWLGDALAALRHLLDGGTIGHLGLEDYVAIHTSPPCQKYTALTKRNGDRGYPDLVNITRYYLEQTGLPYVIENVQGAPVRRDLTLCGEMFGLGVLRHRWFELGGWTAPQPQHVAHRGPVQGWRDRVFTPGPYVAVYGTGGGKGTTEQWQEAMGIDWTSDRAEIAEAIPPAYTEYVGRHLIDHLEEQECAA